MGVLNSAGIAAGVWALMYVSVPLDQTIGAATCLSTSVCCYLLLGEVTTWRRRGLLFGVWLGVVISCRGDLWSSSLGIALELAALFARGMKTALQQYLTAGEVLTMAPRCANASLRTKTFPHSLTHNALPSRDLFRKRDVVFYMALFGIALCLPCAAFVEGHRGMNDLYLFASEGLGGLILIANVACAVAVNFTSVELVKALGGTMFQVGGLSPP